MGFEVWAAGLFGTACLSIWGWLAVKVTELARIVTELRTELQLVSPTKLAKEVQELQLTTLTKEEVMSVIQASAPWTTDSKEWQGWRKSMEEKIDALMTRLTEAGA